MGRLVAKRNEGLSVNNKCLIIFYRNPELGKVKTRLAATLGDEAALAIYGKLSGHTRSVVEELDVDKIVYYSHYIDKEDNWPNGYFEKALQQGSDLGARMSRAFDEAFTKGYRSVCVIGTDCFEVTSEIISKAYKILESRDAVIGPALDGGYYLLGMRKSIPSLFKHKDWSTDSVCSDTIDDLKNLNHSYEKLPILRDVDEESDLPDALRI